MTETSSDRLERELNSLIHDAEMMAVIHIKPKVFIALARAVLAYRDLIDPWHDKQAGMRANEIDADLAAALGVK